MQKIRWFFLIVGIVLAIAMALQNNETASFRLLWLEQTMPLSVMLVSTTGIGFLLGALMTASMLRSRRKKKESEREKIGIEKAAESPKATPPEVDSPNPLS